MDVISLQDKITRGMGVAARKLGLACIVYRPRTAAQPVSDGNRVIKLFAAFAPEGVGGGASSLQPLWRGTFDAVYTQTGDYLVASDRTYFVGSQLPALPIRCVLTNRSLTIARPSFLGQGGYSGLYASGGEPVVTSWPAAVFANGGSPENVRIAGVGLGGWVVLLPRLPVPPQVADVVTDDAGSVYVVGAAEQNTLGWRLLVRQISV